VPGAYQVSRVVPGTAESSGIRIYEPSEPYESELVNYIILPACVPGPIRVIDHYVHPYGGSSRGNGYFVCTR